MRDVRSSIHQAVRLANKFIPGIIRHQETRAVAFTICACAVVASTRGQDNLLKNPGFEGGAAQESPASWSNVADNAQKAVVTPNGAHGGRLCLAIPAQSAVEQRIDHVPAGAYLAHCWVKSEAEQRITFILSDPDRPWAACNLVEAKVPKDQWTQIEVFCTLDQDGSLNFRAGGTSREFRAYHGPETEMRSAILIDDCELIRSELTTSTGLAFWDMKTDADSLTLPPSANTTDVGRANAIALGEPAVSFAETPVFQARHLAGAVRRNDGALVIYATQDKSLKPRSVIIPSPAFAATKIMTVAADGRTGFRIASETGDRSYTAWLSAKGLISIEPNHVSQFRFEKNRVSYGLLPSFVGSDICYSPAKLTGLSRVAIPSTQWFVGLMEGHESMLVAVWDSADQAVSLGLSGEGENRVIDSLSIDTAKSGFSFSFVEHPGIWQRERLKDDYLGDYTSIDWARPFQARWMAQFFVSPGGKRSFHEPFNDYSFPIASAKTRMWGVWFEDWNHYPFYFDGSATMVHFEKSFAPSGDALIYFLEPAAADLYSPCEIVQQALGAEKASALFDLDANALRKLKYSTPPLFMYDRPVCATTTRLSRIKQDEKPTVGVQLATHLYEFIREIRSRIDQYTAFFAATKDYLDGEKNAHAEIQPYVNELTSLVVEAQSKAKKVYDTPLNTVQTRIDAMKKLLEQGKGDGFDCGNLDVRSPAGEQDDLCRRYNRLTLLLMQTAALKCGDSAEKAVIARHIWDNSRAVLRQPTRWEPRRTLYFFEP